MDSTHFKEEMYARYVAECLPEVDLKEIQDHIQGGCRVCEISVRRYRRLSEILQNDLGYEPPESSLKSALNAFRLRKPEKVNLVSVMAQVVFDSFLQPLPAGVRQSVVTDRQVLYQADEMQLDLKIEKTNEENESLIIGQLIPKEKASEQSPSFKAVLREGERVVQSAYSNALGEFVFHVVPKQSYDLEILLAESKKILLTGIPTANESGARGNA